MHLIRSLAILLAATFIADVAIGQESCCIHCGCQTGCQKVCRLVCDTKEITKVTYGCKCEDFCIPGPSHRSKDCCQDECGSIHKCFSWMPGFAHVHTKKVLVRHEEKIKRPTYKWVVEYVCPTCAHHATAQH